MIERGMKRDPEYTPAEARRLREGYAAQEREDMKRTTRYVERRQSLKISGTSPDAWFVRRAESAQTAAETQQLAVERQPSPAAWERARVAWDLARAAWTVAEGLANDGWQTHDKLAAGRFRVLARAAARKTAKATKASRDAGRPRRPGRRDPEAMVGVPYYLSFDGKGGFKPGRGMAGYTVERVPQSKVRDFLARLPRESWMPGTIRLANQLGVYR